MCSWKRTRDSGRERCGVAQAGADLHCLPSGDYTKAKYPSSRRAADRSREAPPRYAGCPASEFDRGALRLLGELGGLLDNVQVEMLLCRVLGINSLFASQFVANRGQIPRSDSQGVLRKSLLLGVKFVSQFRRSARKSRDSLFFIPVNREIGLGDRFDTGCVRHHAFRRQLPYRREPVTTAGAPLAYRLSLIQIILNSLIEYREPEATYGRLAASCLNRDINRGLFRRFLRRTGQRANCSGGRRRCASK